MDKFTLLKEEAVLVVIDIQEKLVPVMSREKDVISNTSILIEASKELNIPVIVTEQYPKGLGKTISELNQNFNDHCVVFEKVGFSAYVNEVDLKLKELGRKKIIITGIETHVCVFQTVRDLLEDGYQVFVVRDAVSSRTDENYRNALELMAGMGAVITNTESVVFDLLKISGTPEFKKLSKLIK